MRRMSLRTPAREKSNRFVLLTRHFFDQFFKASLVGPQTQTDLTVTHILSVLSIPGLFFSLWLYNEHAFLATHFPLFVQDQQALLHKCFFISFSMLVMGFLTVLEWDSLFPDRQDYSILIPLPIEPILLFASKVAAMNIKQLLFSLAINGFATLIFPLAVNGSMGTLLHGDWYRIPANELEEIRKRASLLYAGRFMLAHAVSVLAANAFVLFLCALVQGLLMELFPYRVFHWLSRTLQFLLMLLLLITFFLSPTILSSFSVLMWQNEPFKYFFLPFWFLGLYEVLLGVKDPVFQFLTAIAMGALFFTLAVFFFAYSVSYKRHVGKSLEAENRLRRSRLQDYSLVTKILDRFVITDPLEQGCFYFVAKTLLRSQKHRLFLGAYRGVGVALVMVGLVALVSETSYRTLGQPSPPLLSIPLVLSFFLLVGMRVIFTIPAELEANWIFRLNENEERTRVILGVRKVMLLFGVLPICFFLFPFCSLLWGWEIAALHLVYVATLSLILIEVLLLRFQKIPFTCSYLPGKANIKLFWFAYLVSFMIYGYSISWLESWLLQSPFRFWYFYAVMIALLIGWVGYYRDRMIDRQFRLVYEEEAEPAVQTLDLGH